MTLADFLRHTRTNNCQDEPIEGGNLTGIAVRIINLGNNRKYYLQLYKGGEISDRTIMDACDKLLIKYPDHLSNLVE